MKPIKINRLFALLATTLMAQSTAITAWITPVQAESKTESETTKKTSPARRSRIKFKLPKGQRAPKMAVGGGRRNNGMCESGAVNTIGVENKSIDKTLVPLLPSSKLGLTVSSHPSFMVYVPQTSAKALEFALENEEGEGIFQTEVNIENQNGIVRFNLPKTQPGLEVGKDYRFVISAICQQDGPNNPFVNGLVRRISPADTAVKNQQGKPKSLEQVILYSESGYWFEALEKLAELKLSQPNNGEINTAWEDLLSSVGLDDISKAPLSIKKQQLSMNLE